MTTAKELAFWSCIVIANIWSASSRSIWNVTPWIVLALAIRLPHWIDTFKSLKGRK